MLPSKKQIEFLDAVVLGTLFRKDIQNLSEAENQLTSFLKEKSRVDHKKIQGITKSIFLRNTCHFELAKPLFQYLRSEKIPFSLLKGAAMSLLVYKNLHTRPMKDIDILIPFSYLNEVTNHLKSLDYECDVKHIENYMSVRHACTFTKGLSKIDLHCHIIDDACSDKDNHPFLKQIQSIHFKKELFFVPKPTELLFHTLVHGIRRSTEQSLLWIVDTQAICKQFAVDWWQIILYAKRYRVLFSILMAVRFLREKYIEIPVIIFKTLEYFPKTRGDKKENLFHQREYNGIYSSLRHHCHLFRIQKKLSFLTFCQYYWDSEKKSDFFLSCTQKILKKIKKSYQKKRPSINFYYFPLLQRWKLSRRKLRVE